MAPEEVHQLLSTTEYFGKLADSYGDGGYYRKRREATLAAVKQEVGSIANLLDLGCGNGTYLVRFRRTSILRFWLAPASRWRCSRAPGCGRVALKLT